MSDITLTVDARQFFIVTLVDVKTKRTMNVPAYVANMQEAATKAEEYIRGFAETDEGKIPENKDVELKLQSVVTGGTILT